jgi:hypothetical protein
MRATMPDTGMPTTSCWTTDYWLRHCEGFAVWDAGERLGSVEGVLTAENDEPCSLVVRVGGSMFTQLVSFPIESVEALDPAAERVFVAPTAPTAEREGRQLKIPALAL